MSSFVLSDNETVIKTYKCAKISVPFKKSIPGLMIITNKRVVFQNEDGHNSNNWIISSEIPLNDVSGIQTHLYNYFNIVKFLLFSFVVYIISTSMFKAMPGLLGSWVVEIVLIFPFLLNLLFEKNIISKEAEKAIVEKLEGTEIESFIKKKDKQFYVSLFRILFLIGINFLSLNIVTNLSFRWSPVFGYVFLPIVYYFMYKYIFINDQQFGVSIYSRSSNGIGISIQTIFLIKVRIFSQ